jgi:hypothetical protein
MIESAEEFYRLRMSEKQEEYDQAYRDEAPEEVWLEVIERYPDMRYWVAANKTVPLTILKLLSGDPDPRVRHCVAGRRKLDMELFRRLAMDPDYGIRGEIARNKKVPVEVLKILLKDTDEWVREVASEKLKERIGHSSPNRP